MCRGILLKVLGGIEQGEIILEDADGIHAVGSAPPDSPSRATVEIRDPAFYPAVLLQQSEGTGKSYMDGWWRCSDLVVLIRIFARNEKILRRWTAPTRGLLGVWHRLALWTKRNNLAGARRNIAAHYDQGEDFFAAFLDPSLTYSCAVFTEEAQDLDSAQAEKLDRVCRKLDLGPKDHVLEIGTGWGSLAIHAAREYGCRVTTTTLSSRQARYARARIGELGLTDRITVLEQDYRDLQGKFDKLVSLEMIEAVGVNFYPTFFERCADLLRKDGAMLLQAIIVDDRHFEHDARHVDFIKRYIFPGGVLPSISVIAGNIARTTDLQIAHLEDLTDHYALTLKLWRRRLRAAWNDLRARGKDLAFLRCWEFYFAYCEGGFRERRIGDVQVLMVKPQGAGLRILQVPPAATALQMKEGRAS
jgi:cyclopropane-fatty-acyl-phospholipid synthase